MPPESTDEGDPLAWARDYTPILRSFQAEYGESKPLDGHTVAFASHLEAKTGVAIETLHEAGTEVLFAPSEPQSTHGDVVTALDARDGITAFAWEGMTDEEFDNAQHELLEHGPDFILDDGCELIAKVHADHPDVAANVIGGGEQTTVGITRLEAMEREGVLQFPVYGVNDTPMKRYFDNVHGTGESSLTNIAITTNSIISGKDVVVCGYGYCGRGIARKARGMGGQTIVTEVDPRKALQAHMDGHRVMEIDEASKVGDLFISATGNRNVLRTDHFERMKDGAILANSGHFDVEIDSNALESMADDVTTPKEGITRYHMPDGRRLNLLADGRLVNLTGPHSQGHPAEVMDTTFAMMFVAAYEMLAEGVEREPGLHSIPDRLDREVASRKLDTLGISIDDLTESQQAYYDEWEHPDSSF
ncbi:adenosylhomocysteinase [Halogeometricum borinquense]|uniref:adenosylhomocysteinase n=1 Tax=Halogeometricum borinquense TaxID=60847 RepID=UPI00342B517F